MTASQNRLLRLASRGRKARPTVSRVAAGVRPAAKQAGRVATLVSTVRLVRFGTPGVVAAGLLLFVRHRRNKKARG